MFKQLRLNFTGIFPSAIPSDSMSNLSKILFHSSIGMEEDAFDVKVYVREMARVNMLKKVEIIFVLKQANLFHAQILSEVEISIWTSSNVFIKTFYRQTEK